MRRFALIILASFPVLACGLGAWLSLPASAAATTGASQIGLTENGVDVSGPGRLANPTGVAVNNDPSSLYYGDIYVADADRRVDRFGASGDFQLAWGWGVANGAEELQTCTSTCQAGKEESREAGAVSVPESVAVDSNELSASSSSGDVYVFEGGEIDRVEKFGPAGEFLLLFGGEVNEAKDKTPGATLAEKDVCRIGEKCQTDSNGTANGQFYKERPGPNSERRRPCVTVGPSGKVYVADGSPRVQVFEPSGVWVETISLSKLSATGSATSLAVNGDGDVFVKDSRATGVREFEPGGVEKPVQFDSASNTVTSIAVDGSGDLFVGDSNNSNFGFHVLKYAQSGKIADSFGAKTVRGGSFHPESLTKKEEETDYLDGMAFSVVTDSVYASESFSEGSGFGSKTSASIWALVVPPPGPLIALQSATPGQRASLRLEASLDPEGNETTYHFEYVSQAAFEADGYASAKTTASFELPVSLEEQPVSVEVTGLSPASVYHYRLVASNSEGVATGGDQVVETYPAALIESVYATNVASSSATIDLDVNPLGTPTSYRLEYGAGGAYDHVVTGSLGEGATAVAVGDHLQGLEPDTTYHYRVLTSSAVGAVTGGDLAFTTQRAVVARGLADGRSWEMVSPPDKKGSLIAPFEAGIIQAAANGDGISYLSREAIGVGASGKTGTPDQILSRRVAGVWRTQDIVVPHVLASEEEDMGAMVDLNHEYWLFSQDLTLAIFDTEGVIAPLSPEATERTPYLRANLTGSFRPLVSPANVVEGVKFGGGASDQREGFSEVHLRGATPDLSYIVLSSPFALTPGSTTLEKCPKFVNKTSVCELTLYNLYEWHEGELKLIDVLPEGEGGKPLQLNGGPYDSASLGRSESGIAELDSMTARSMSSDGRWVVWEAIADSGGADLYGVFPAHLYVRDMSSEKTYRLGGSNPSFQMISADGSKVFFLEKGELYVFDTATGKESDLTSSHGPEASANVQDSLLGVSADGTHVYFVARGVLAQGTVSGAENLYELRDEDGVWSTVFIAVLSSDDNPDWFPHKEGHCSGTTPASCTQDSSEAVHLGRVTSSVSPDGRFVEFMSDRSLTGYDNRDAVSGQPDEEVYLYDDASGRLICASCNPTGARPTGVYDAGHEYAFFDEAGAWESHWVAGIVPGWRGAEQSGQESQYQPRFLSNSGRLFFDSPDALVPLDANGLMDVYEYEPAGVGDCTAASDTFSERSGGCVGLMSSGTSSSDSVFLDASESGNDVFFVTTSKLTAADYDTSYDVYDAHVCSIEVPCESEPVAPPPCDSGDSCKAAPSPQPEIYGPPPSATFAGSGNILVEPALVSKDKAKGRPSKHKKRKPRHKRGARRAVAGARSGRSVKGAR